MLFPLDIDECKSLPCQNGGNCTDGIGSYTCYCIPGHTGDNCETSLSRFFSVCTLDLSYCPLLDIGECASDPCQNGGTCIDEINAFTCMCMRGYTGDICETSKNVNEENGNVKGHFHFVDIDECNSSPCENGGTCVDGVYEYTCSCTSGHTGDQCEASKNFLADKCFTFIEYLFLF